MLVGHNLAECGRGQVLVLLCSRLTNCSPIHTPTMKYILILQYSQEQYSTVQYSTVQYSTVQYSTVQYSARPAGPPPRRGCPPRGWPHRTGGCPGHERPPPTSHTCGTETSLTITRALQHQRSGERKDTQDATLLRCQFINDIALFPMFQHGSIYET